MKRIGRVKSFLLILSLVLAVLAPMKVFAAEDTGSIAASNTKQLYTIGYTDYENGSGVKKGNTQDCQHLGVWIKKGTVFKIRQTNANFKQNLTLRLRNDDSKTENSVTIPANGSWVSITARADGVPFVTSVYSSNRQRPVVEWKTEGGGELYNLPVYDYEDEERSEKAFYQMWNDTDAPFAVMECRRAVLLVPKINKTENGFKSLDRLLEYYNEMVDQYNLFAGMISKDSPDAQKRPWDVDSETRFFMKANKNGVGLAYYGPNECGYNSKSMYGYLTYGWVLNHEVGHGYKTPAGIGTQDEVWNNVFGHYYQHTIENKSDWGGVDKDTKRKSYETGKPYPGGSNYGRSLYFWTNMFDKIGPQYTISNFYKQYRYDKYSPNSTVNPDTGWDYYSKSFTKISGYNVIPYFEKWGLYGREASKNEIIEAGTYKNVYPLGQLSTKEETLAAVNKDLNLGSNYAFVETQELVKYNKYSGTAKFTFDDASFDILSGKKITITDGVNTVKEVVIDSKTLDVTLPIGVYNVLLDKKADKIAINNSRGFLVIRDGETKTYSVTVNQRYADSLAKTEIRYKGLGFDTYFTAIYDSVKMQVRMKTENKKPHSYFSEKDGTYSSITLYDDKGNVIYTKEHIGNIASPEDKTFDIQEGYRVKVYHNNDSKVQSRNQIVYSYGGNATPVALENTVTYEFTKKGLKRVVSSKPMTDAELNENYYKTLTAYFDSLIKKTDSASWKDGESLLEEKSIISAAYEVLTAEQKNKFKTAYSAYFPFENTISTWEVGTIPDQTYTGSPIVPDVTVRSSNGTILKKGTDYKVTFSNNENVGTAQAVVTGLGSYKNFVSKINFNIVLGNVDFTAAVDQKEYNYNGYKVTPSMTVKDNGRVLERNVDYKIIYKNNINVGTATATAKGIGNYEGFESQDTFTIKGYAPGIKITVAPKKAVYNGETITAAVTVYDATYPSSGTKTLKAGVDYTVAGNSAVNVGKHTITVNGIGNYSGVAATGAFEITESANTAIPDTTELANYRFDLKGYNNYTYAKLYVDIEKGDCKLVEEKRQPHNYFKEQVYSYVRIYDQNGAQLLYAEQLGNHTLARNTHTCDIGIGCVIELFHKEPKNRAVIVPEYDYNNQDTTNRISVTDNVTKYIVTNTGINRIYPTDKKTDSQKAFYDSLVKYTDKYLAANYQGALYDNQDYVWDAVINKSLILLSDGNKASFTAKYNKKYKVTLDNKGGTSVTELVRDIRSGSKKTVVSVPAKAGYFFAGYYDAVDGGTKYYNKDGSPTTETWNLTGNITLYAQWTAAVKEATPAAAFSAETMKLTGVTSGMKYRIDTGSWMDINGNTVDLSSKVTKACTIYVVKKGNGSTTIDSAEQTITVTKAKAPSLTATQPTVIAGKGSIPMSSAHEYKLQDAITWTKAEGPTELAAGTYLVRVAASGAVLASDAQEITIKEFAAAKEATPAAAFSAATMKLTGVTSGMKYRVDDGSWIDIDGTDDITLNICEACTISVVKKGNGTTTIDSAEQIITVTKAETPTLTAAQPEGIDGKGSIPTTEAHEFSEDGINYTECAGPTDDLEQGTYYVRVAASGTALASDAQEIIINAFVQGKETTPNAAFSAETMKLTGVTSGMKYRIDNGEWIDVDGSDDITLNISEACTISVVKEGNGSTTIDSAEQTIIVTKAETPTLTAAQPEGIDGKGSIPTTEAHEFSEDGINYTECVGPTDDLEPGIYYVRVAASGTALASDAQEITISAFITPDEPTPDDNPTINNTVYFNANGGSVTPDSTETSEEGRLSILPTPTRNGYTFDGWYVEEAGGTEVTTDTVFDADTTIYAHWTANPVIDGGTAGGGGMIIAPIIPPILPPEQPSTEPTQSGNATIIDLSEDTVSKGGKTRTLVEKEMADKLVETAVKNKSEEIVISTVTKNQSAASVTKSSEVTLPAEALQTIADKTNASITIKTNVAEIKLDNKAVEAVASQIHAETIGKDEIVTIIAEKVKEESEEVRLEVKILTSSGICIYDFNGGNAVITVNVPKSFSNKKIVCVYIDANGFMHKVDGGINADGTYSFTTGHFSTYSIMSEENAYAEIKEQKEAVKAIKLKLRSEIVKTKSGKKVIKLTWTNPSDIEFEGVEIYRSLKKNSGYGKKPIYISKSGKYINTAVKAGKKYYYKVRGFVTIDGEKVYTEYSAKSYRTVK